MREPTVTELILRHVYARWANTRCRAGKPARSVLLDTNAQEEVLKRPATAVSIR